jgi:D-cysteine desulfhydrase
VDKLETRSMSGDNLAGQARSALDLARFPRRRYTPHVTAIEPLANLGRALTAGRGGPTLWIKRDDTLGLAGGGNKTRKLEFLVADALARDADTLITCGAPQSNHCRLTLAAAAREGLKCRLVLEERVPGTYDPAASGNNFLFSLLGVEKVIVVPGGSDLMSAMAEAAVDLPAAGRKAYIIPGGGSNALGALGYVACADEIIAQTFGLGLALDHIVCPSGSAGTHAGLLVGLEGRRTGIPVTGVNVSRPRAQQEANVHTLAAATATSLGLAGAVRREAVTCLDEWVGPGYSLPTPEMIEAVHLLARLEGVLLDPVYTGKAMAGLIGLVRRGHFKEGENVLFLHTGGSPALFAYQDVLRP